MKKPYIAGLNSYVEDPDGKTTEQLLRRSGNNLGNFMFCASVRRFVRTRTCTATKAIDVEVVKRECDGIVIPAANWLQPKSDLSRLAEQIEAADVPTVILGLGAQAGEGGRIPELTAGMLRFLRAVSERCESMSVRGAFSAEVLNHYGIRNVQQTGCPSLLYHLNHSARVTRLPEKGAQLSVATAATLPDLVEKPKSDNPRLALARLLLGESLRNGYDHVAQTEVSMIQAKRGELRADDPAWAFLCHAFGDAPRRDVESYIDNRVHAFTNIPDWLVYMANKDFVLGTRLHGVIAALLAGTPAMLITHDSRTVEMAQFAGIPHVSGQSLIEEGRIDLKALIEQADFAAFNRRQESSFRSFRAFLDANGVPHRLASF